MKGLIPGSIYQDSGNLGKRDAFHVPAILCSSSVQLKPGDKVRFVTKNEVVKANNQHYHGYADIFIKEDVIEAGSEFYVFMKPDTVTEVRHTFTVEGLPEEKDDSTSSVKEIKDMITSLMEENTKLKIEYKQLEATNQSLEEELDADGCRGCW